MSHDPLLTASTDNARELFTRFGQQANGFATEDVVGAALNLVINGIRQTYSSRDEAEKHFDELLGKTKAVLMDHYDILGRKRGVFPFDQTIDMSKIDFRQKGWK